MRWVPLTLFTVDGELWLHDGRLTFTSSRRVVFDALVEEFHSVAHGATAGLYVWHGDRRLRFVTGDVSGRVASTPDSLLGAVDALTRVGSDLERDRENRQRRDAWVDLLTPLVGAPPPGCACRGRGRRGPGTSPSWASRQG